MFTRFPLILELNVSKKCDMLVKGPSKDQSEEEGSNFK